MTVEQQPQSAYPIIPFVPSTERRIGGGIEPLSVYEVLFFTRQIAGPDAELYQLKPEQLTGAALLATLAGIDPDLENAFYETLATMEIAEEGDSREQLVLKLAKVDHLIGVYSRKLTPPTQKILDLRNQQYLQAFTKAVGNQVAALIHNKKIPPEMIKIERRKDGQPRDYTGVIEVPENLRKHPQFININEFRMTPDEVLKYIEDMKVTFPEAAPVENEPVAEPPSEPVLVSASPQIKHSPHDRNIIRKMMGVFESIF